MLQDLTPSRTVPAVLLGTVPPCRILPAAAGSHSRRHGLPSNKPWPGNKSERATLFQEALSREMRRRLPPARGQKWADFWDDGWIGPHRAVYRIPKFPRAWPGTRTSTVSQPNATADRSRRRSRVIAEQGPGLLLCRLARRLALSSTTVGHRSIATEYANRRSTPALADEEKLAGVASPCAR